MKGHQHVGRAEVQLRLVAAGIEHAGERVVAEILQQQEAVGGVFGEDLGRAEFQGAEMPADAHERPHVFLRWWRIHDHGRAVGPRQAEVLSKRGVARQQALARIGPAGTGDEIGAEPGAVRHRATRGDHRRRPPG